MKIRNNSYSQFLPWYSRFSTEIYLYLKTKIKYFNWKTDFKNLQITTVRLKKLISKINIFVLNDCFSQKQEKNMKIVMTCLKKFSFKKLQWVTFKVIYTNNNKKSFNILIIENIIAKSISSAISMFVLNNLFFH